MARVKQTARMSTGGKAPRRSKQENKPKSRGGRRVKQTARMSTGGKAPRGQALIEYEESLEKEKELMARKNTIEAEKKMLTEAAKTPVKNAEALVKKGDVVWVRYRQDPLWPALVQNVQPKKMTYVFFPLSKNDSEKKPQLFSCNPNSVYCLSVAEKPQVGAPKDVLKALKEAKLYLINEGRLEGSAMIPRPDAELMSDEERKKEFPLPIILDVQPRAETKKNEKDSSGDAKEKEEEGVDVGVEILEDDEEEVKEVKKVEKIKKNEVVKQDKEVKKKEEDKKNEEVKKGDVVKKVEESKKNEEVKKDDVVKKVEESKKNEVKKGEEFKQDVELNKEQVKDDEKKEEEVKEDEEPAQKKARLDSPSSTKQGTSGADEDLNAFAEVVEKNYSTILELLYTEKTATEHVVPFRRDIGFSMNCSRFLSDHDTDVLFENIMDFVKNKEGLCRSLPAFHFVCDFLFPEVIIRSFMIHRRIGYEAAKRIVFRPEESNGDTA